MNYSPGYTATDHIEMDKVVIKGDPVQRNSRGWMIALCAILVAVITIAGARR